MSKDQLLKIAQDKEGKYDVNTQLQAAKRLSDPKLNMTFTDSDLKSLSPYVLEHLSVTGSASLKNHITFPPVFIGNIFDGRLHHFTPHYPVHMDQKDKTSGPTPS